MNNELTLLFYMNDTIERLMMVTRRIKSIPSNAYNPYAARLLLVLQELEISLAKVNHYFRFPDNKAKLKNDLSIIYRAFDEVLEFQTMLIRTMKGVPPFLFSELKQEVKMLQKLLVDFVTFVIQIFGRRQTLFIITPEFQSLSGLW